MATAPIIVQVDDNEHIASDAEKAQIELIRTTPGPEGS